MHDPDVCGLGFDVRDLCTGCAAEPESVVRERYERADRERAQKVWPVKPVELPAKVETPADVANDMLANEAAMAEEEPLPF